MKIFTYIILLFLFVGLFNFDVNGELHSDNSLEYLHSSFLIGGSFDDIGHALARDNDNNILIGGTTGSPDFFDLRSFNISEPYNYYENGSGFIIKFSEVGEDPIWVRLLGGTNITTVLNMKTDSMNNIIVTGVTNSFNVNVTNNAYDSQYNGNTDGFVTKFDSDGTILWSTFLGGSDRDYASDLTISQNDDIIVVGHTNSEDFPTTSDMDETLNGTEDGFITKFSSSGDLIWSTYFGGSDRDLIHAVINDHEDGIILTGMTHSIDFPTKNAYQPNLGENEYGIISDDGFITNLFQNGSLNWSTYYGHSSHETSYDVVTNSFGEIIISGYYTGKFELTSSTHNFTTSDGSFNIFISCFNNTGGLIWSSVLGGNGSDIILEHTVSEDGIITLVGQTTSLDFPLMNAYDNSLDGSQDVNYDGFFASFSVDGDLLSSSFLGGTSYDAATDCIYLNDDELMIIGATMSNDFPVKNSNQNSFQGSTDTFISIFSRYPPQENTTSSFSSSTSNFPSQKSSDTFNTSANLPIGISVNTYYLCFLTFILSIRMKRIYSRK